MHHAWKVGTIYNNRPIHLTLYTCNARYTFFLLFHLQLNACSKRAQSVIFVDSTRLKFAYRTFQSNFLQKSVKKLNNAIQSLLGNYLTDPKLWVRHKERERNPHFDCILRYHKSYHKMHTHLSQGNFLDIPTPAFPPHDLALAALIQGSKFLQHSYH